MAISPLAAVPHRPQTQLPTPPASRATAYTYTLLKRSCPRDANPGASLTSVISMVNVCCEPSAT
eukprot:2111477-Prymnesium_polylepis.1